MLNLVRKIQERIIPQAEDIFEHFYAKPDFTITEIPNELGGNSELHVSFRYHARYYDGKMKEFVYRPASQTQEAFINEIRAYLLDCVDGLINLGY